MAPEANRSADAALCRDLLRRYLADGSPDALAALFDAEPGAGLGDSQQRRFEQLALQNRATNSQNRFVPKC